jgi:hypothetical protein
MTWIIPRPTLILGIALLAAGGCSSFSTSRKPERNTSNFSDYLYPQGISKAAPASEVELRLPLRVGLAFAPAARDRVSKQQKQALFAEVAAAFKSHSGIGRLELIPSRSLKAFGGFANVDEIARRLELDLIALISYYQDQLYTYKRTSGPPFQEAKINTYIVANVVVYDIKSRTQLLRVFGDSDFSNLVISDTMNLKGEFRKFSTEGFNQAIPKLIGNLNTALTELEKQAESGTVRGAGTP